MVHVVKKDIFPQFEWEFCEFNLSAFNIVLGFPLSLDLPHDCVLQNFWYEIAGEGDCLYNREHVKELSLGTYSLMWTK